MDQDLLRDKSIKRISVIGIVINVFLLIIKITIGIFSKSQAMIADAVNSAGDIFASTMSYIGAKLSAKPKDEEHPYGHGKAEYVFALLIAIFMIIVAITMIDSAVKSIIFGNSIIFSYILIVVCVVTIITKFFAFLYCNFQAKKYKSILIKASMEDHRNDMIITIGTLIGVIASFLGYTYIDSIFGIITSLWIAYVGFKLFKDSYNVLIDTSIDPEKQDEIIKETALFKEVLHVDSVKSKPTGHCFVIILKISMDGEYTLNVSHEIAGKIKEELIKKFEYISDVIVHINPHKI